MSVTESSYYIPSQNMDFVPQTTCQPEPDQNGPAFACLRCWRLKKRCDRLSPKCSRCSSGSIHCVYSVEPPTRSQIHNRDYKQVAILRSVDPDRSKDVFNVTLAPMGKSTENVFHLELPAYNLLPERRLESVPDYRNIYDTFNDTRLDIEDALNIHAQTMNMWLPIITTTQLQEYSILLKEKKNLDLDTCAILLSIQLITRESSPTMLEITEPETLYTALKSFLASRLRDASSLTIQLGLLIAIFEHGNALDEEARKSIHFCWSMGYLMRMDRTLDRQPPSNKLEAKMFNADKHAWWCVIILERLFSLENPSNHREFACYIGPSSYLPASPISTTTHSPIHSPTYLGTVPLPSSSAPPSSPHTITFSPTHSFGRTSQAIYLLTLTANLISQAPLPSNLTTWYQEAESLDNLLQEFILCILNESNLTKDGEWHYTCCAYFICISALFNLHTHSLTLRLTPLTLSLPIHPTHPTSPLIFRQKSTLALQSLARTLIMNSTSQPISLFSDAKHIPPYGLHYLRDTGVFSVEMIKKYQDREGKGEDVDMDMDIDMDDRRDEKRDKESWKENLRFLKEYLEGAGEKWKIGREYLNEIKKSEQSFGK